MRYSNTGRNEFYPRIMEGEDTEGMRNQLPLEKQAGDETRPFLNRKMGSEIFREYYYLKEELVKILPRKPSSCIWRKTGIN